jgi:hypothetical protein
MCMKEGAKGSTKGGGGGKGAKQQSGGLQMSMLQPFEGLWEPVIGCMHDAAGTMHRNRCLACAAGGACLWESHCFNTSREEPALGHAICVPSLPNG